MQFIDKTLNRVIKWENRDISISEMLELIESEIIAKSSDKDLVRLEKGMFKTWVLAVGRGSSLRYYPSFGAPVHLCLEFNMFTHNIQQITLQDTTSKVEYFIPRGKESCKKLQRAVLRRLAQYAGGEVETRHRPRQGGKFQSQKQSPSPLKWLGMGCLGIAVAGTVLIAILNPPSIGGLLDGLFSDTPEWVSTVQNGYLGEYTDVTVYELLSAYRTLYKNEVWNGGTTDATTQIAEVRFTSPQSDDSTTIQFQMLNKDVFKVSAFVDTTQPNATNSNILYTLNLMYYSEAGMKYLLEDGKADQLCALMRTVDANEVSYGAAAGYTGDRSVLYKLDGGSLMGLSAADLMEYYGTPLIDSPDHCDSEQETEAPVMETPEYAVAGELPAFTADELMTDLNQNVMRAKMKYQDVFIILTGRICDFYEDGQGFTMSSTSDKLPQIVLCAIAGEEQLSDLLNANVGDVITIRCKVTHVEQSVGYEVETLSIEEIVPGSQMVQNDANSTGTDNLQTGTVRWSSGGLKVRGGPGTSYPEIRRLEPGAAVTISEQQNVNGTYWGNIGDGWICMDYVDIGSQQSQSTGGSSTSVNMTVCVKLTAGELRIRSGPDSSYSEVGRLYGGEIITVTELQQNGSTQWGRIPQGWICMDYVDTVYDTQEERSSAQRFIGSWIESNNANKRCMLTIQSAEYGSFLIEVQLSLTAALSMNWYTMAEYDANQDCITYSHCKCRISESDGSGFFREEVKYQNGQGKLYFSNGYLYWSDYSSDINNCPFVPN